MNTLTAAVDAPRSGIASAKRELPCRFALGSLSASMLLSSLGTSLPNVGLPTLARDFGASFQGVQWIVLAYLLSITSLIVVAGRLGDLAGRRRVLLAGLAVFTAASALGAMAPSLGWLIAARAVQGAGGAAMMALTLALVSETVPKAGIGRAMGLLGTMSAIGTASGPALGGWLVDGFGWASLFWVNVPLGVLTFAMAWRCLPTQGSVAAAMVTRFDLRGTLVLALTLAAYTLALTPGHGAFDATQAMLFALAVAGLILFMRVESRATSPLVQLSRLRDRALSRGLLASVLVSTVLMATLVVGPFYLARGLALEPSLVGLVLAVGPVVVALSGVPAGRLVDRLGAARLVRIGLASIAAGALGLAFAPSRWGVPGYLAPMVVLTAGYALFQTANNTAVMNGIAASERGVISGLLSLSRNVGLITGTAAMGAVFALATATSDMASATPAAVSTGLRVTFAVAALLMIGTLVMLEWRRDRA